jgi:hypothetical protein
MTFRKGWVPTQKNQIIVESFADGAFVTAVSQSHGIPAFDYTTPLGTNNRPLGKSGFKEHLRGMRLFIERRQVDRVVVIGDNDDDHSAAFTDVKKGFSDAGGYPTIGAPAVAVHAAGLHTGVLLLPATGENGCLETLLLKSTLRVPVSQDCIDQWRDCIGFQTAPRNPYHKFRVRAIIEAAIRSKPDLSLSDIWTNGNCPFDPADPAFNWVADFLRAVFVD